VIQVDYPQPKQIRAFGNQYLGTLETAIVVDLIASVNPRVVLEFGTNLGKTARAVLDALPVVELYVGIDVPRQHVPRLACQRSEVPMAPGHYAAGDKRYQLLLADSAQLEAADLEPVDAVFIDGDHSAQAVAHDSHLARALLRPGGIIIWHDYNNSSVEVNGVLDRLVEEGWPLQTLRDTWLAFMRNDHGND
jgi:predicted O-methyltransferase YrrM